VTIFVENLYYSSNPILKIYADLAENLRKIGNSLIYLMANFEDFLSNFSYPASYLAFAHKDCSEGASANKRNCHPWISLSLSSI